jgi:hypothetical protein
VRCWRARPPDAGGIEGLLATLETAAVIRIQENSVSPSIRSQRCVVVDVLNDHHGAAGANLESNDMSMVFNRLQAISSKPPCVRFFSNNFAGWPYTLPANQLRGSGRVLGNWRWS